MKICFVTEYFPESGKVELRGGVEARCYYMARELAKKHEVTVVTSSEQRAGVSYGKIGRVRIIRCGKHRYTHQGAWFSRLKFAWNVYRTWPLLKERGVELMDGQNFISYLPAYSIAKKLGTPAVATYHEVWLGEWVQNKGIGTGLLGALWERMVLQCPWNKIVANSHFTKQRLAQQGIAKKDIIVVHNGVDFSQYKKMYEKYAQPTVCCIARLTEKKRVEDLLRALAVVKRDIPEIRCKIIGSGREEQRLRKLANELGIGDAVSFLGYVKEHAKVVQILKRSHVFCLPSVLEGFGIAVVEAMACGVPYVCTDIPPLREITQNGKGGFLFAPKQPKALAEKVLLLLQNKGSYRKKQQEARKIIRRYDWRLLARQAERLYGGVLHG